VVLGSTTDHVSSKISDSDIQYHLNQILASRSFEQADRLKRFLSFVVQETLAGRGDQLKEFILGVEVFDKDSSFDPRNDPIVRVQARRLRSRLERYYANEGQRDAIRIELQKGSYTPVFRQVMLPISRTMVASPLLLRNTIAVIPFEDFSPHHDLEYLCKGISLEIIQALSAVEHIRLIAWTNGSVTQESNHSDAALYVTGSVRKFDDYVRVTAHIIDVASKCYLWTESIDGPINKPLFVQEATAQKVAEKIRRDLANIRGLHSSHYPAENLAAHNLYLQGRYHLNQRTEEGLRKAVEFFEKALVEDSQYFLAYAGLADAYGLLGHYGVLAPAEVWTKTAYNASTAVSLCDSSAEAHTSLAHVRATQDWDWAGSEREFRLAIKLDPRYATAHHWFGISCLAPLGRLEEALQELLVAQALDPISPIIARDVAIIYYYQRDFDAALEQCDHTIGLNPYFSEAYWTLGLIQEQRKDFEEAAAAFQRAIQLSPNSPRMHAGLARIRAMSGGKKEAEEILRRLQEMVTRRYVSPFEFASVYFALGKVERAFEWLQKAVQDRCFELVGIKVDPRFDFLKTDSRFTYIVEQLGLA